jgi:predicted phosphodiesterase
MKSDFSRAGSPLFSFAVIADTHVNPDDGQSSSPWQTNRLANWRALSVVAQLNALKPDFVIHLGDMVHPVPSQAGYAAAARRFRALFKDLQMPLYLVSGNHDVGDKPIAWTPAVAVNYRFLAIYREHFGKDFYGFDHRGCRFIIINSQILNSGLSDEHEQWMWLEKQLATEQRLFLFKHYPPFLHDADEPEHYDNIAEPARSRLLKLLRGHPVEALFCGHVHNFFYNRISGADCYVVPATSAVRHDYMELFPVAPMASEHGRDARAKLGFFWVDVFADSHVAHWVRTCGATDSVGAVAHLERPRTHARGPAHAPVGVDLRHGWLDSISIPPTGAVDEFSRKIVRNDYDLAALWELGIRRLRIPLQDLMAPASSRRVAELAEFGHRFTVFMFGLPDARQRAELACHAASLDAVELIERGPVLSKIGADAGALKSELGVPVYLSKLHVSGEDGHDEGQFAHVIRHGLRPGEPAPATLIKDANRFGFEGLVYRVDWEEVPWSALHSIAESVRAAHLRAIVHVRLAGNNPAQEMVDDANTARRVADAALAAWCLGDRISVFFDTFADHDRGYFPRHGLVDRSCDPRPAGLVLKRLVDMLSSADSRRIAAAADGIARVIRTSSRQIVLLLPYVQPDDSCVGLTTSWLTSGDHVGVRLDTGARIRATIGAGQNGLTIKWDRDSARRERPGSWRAVRIAAPRSAAGPAKIVTWQPPSSSCHSTRQSAAWRSSSSQTSA